MDEKDEKKEMDVEKHYTPILPYDSTLHEDFSMYDRPVYTRDLSLFDNNERMMNRGNVIHFFECKKVAPRKVGGDIIDAEISEEKESPEE